MMSCCAFSQIFYKKKSDTIVEISIKDVRKIVLLQHHLDQCEQIKSVLLNKIQQDSLLIEHQIELNQSLQQEITLQQEIITTNEHIKSELTNDLKKLKIRNRKNIGLLASVGMVLLAFLVLK